MTTPENTNDPVASNPVLRQFQEVFRQLGKPPREVAQNWLATPNMLTWSASRSVGISRDQMYEARQIIQSVAKGKEWGVAVAAISESVENNTDDEVVSGPGYDPPSLS